MSEIIYEIFVKGVAPLAVVGVLGYAGKKFINLQGPTKWRILSFGFILIILSAGLYYFYTLVFSPYTTQFIPETCNIPGTSIKTDLKRSYWQVTKDTPISFPILIKEDRVLSVNLKIDKGPVTVEYIAERGAHKVVFDSVDASLFVRKSTDELKGKDVYISEPISKNDEKYLVIKAKMDSDLKIYSYTVERYYSSVTNWLTFIFATLIFVSFITTNFLSKKISSKALNRDRGEIA